MKPIRYLTNRTTWYLGAIRFAWTSNTFKFWTVLCIVGIVIGLIVGIGMTKLVILVAIATMGWSLEIANTAIEHLCDLVEPSQNPKVKIVKDAFGAVPAFIFTSYLITWGILVLPTLVEKLS